MVRIYHNSLWARYKGAIFSKIFELHRASNIDVAFIHIAETSDKRAVLGPPDLSYHSYPHQLLFRESSDHLPAYKMAFALIKDILRDKSQLVVIPGYHRIEYWAMLVACMVLGRKRAVFCDSTANDNVKTRFKEAAKAFFFRRCHGFFCYGMRSKDYIQSYGIDAGLIHSPCQAAALPHDYDSAAVLKRYEAAPERSEDAPTFLFVGRLSSEKGLGDLLEAFRSIHRQSPGAKLVFAGSGTERERLQRQVSQWDLEKSISFLGNRSPHQIGELLESSTALVLPSHQEPWGLVVNEALSYGCPVVVSDICGCTPELVVSGITGYGFPAGDKTALREAMLQSIGLRKHQLKTAKRCLEVISHYTPERAASEILKGCSQILRTRNTQTSRQSIEIRAPG